MTLMVPHNHSIFVQRLQVSIPSHVGPSLQQLPWRLLLPSQSNRARCWACGLLLGARIHNHETKTWRRPSRIASSPFSLASPLVAMTHPQRARRASHPWQIIVTSMTAMVTIVSWVRMFRKRLPLHLFGCCSHCRAHHCQARGQHFLPLQRRSPHCRCLQPAHLWILANLRVQRPLPNPPSHVCLPAGICSRRCCLWYLGLQVR